MRILTVGHSTHPIARFLELLRAHGVELVVDVRSTPFSRFNPQFNRQPLTASLAEAGIAYEFLGDALGARSEDPACYVNDRVSYERLARTPQFQQGLARVREVAQQHCAALMCAERDPVDCHRTMLVGRELERGGARLAHILADGSLEEQRHMMERLAEKLGLDERAATDDLFGVDDAARFEAAYDAQSRRIAYVRKPARPRRADRTE